MKDLQDFFSTICLLVVSLLFLSDLSGQVTFFQEDFETDGRGSRYYLSTSFVIGDGDTDAYFGRVENINGELFFVDDDTIPVNLNNQYIAQNGNHFFATENLGEANCFGSYVSMESLGTRLIHIDGASEITCKVLIANGADECGNYKSRWDIGEGLKIYYRLGSSNQIFEGLCFSPNLECSTPGDTSNQPLHLDLDCDGDGEDGFVSNVFTEYSFTIPATDEDVLRLIIETTSNTSGEELAFDNIRLEAVVPPVECICPEILSIEASPNSICVGESFGEITVNVYDSELLDSVFNACEYYSVKLIYYPQTVDDPYVPQAGNVILKRFQSADFTAGSATITIDDFSTDISDGGYLYTILDPRPLDPSCRPFAELELEVYPLPPTDLILDQDSIPADEGIVSGIGGGIPAGGIYSGDGVVDEGDGLNFSVDPSLITADTVLVLYTYTNENGCESLSFQWLPLYNSALAVDLSLMINTINISEGETCGIGGGTPEGGVYSGLGVIDEGNGLTFCFDPVETGVGAFPITYTYASENSNLSGSNQAVDSMTVFMSSSLKEIAAANFQLVPNPAGEMVWLTLDEFESVSEYRLFNTNGVLAKEGILNPGSNQINLQQLPIGVYYLYVKDDTDGTWAVKKLIKQ